MVLSPLQSTRKDVYGTLSVAAAYLASGDKDQAKATAEKAIKMVDPKNAGMLRYIEQQAKKYGAGAGKE
jgi:Tfp pilus assembly protein PilF